MIFLIHHIRKIIFVFSIILSLLIFFWANREFPSENLRITRLTQFFALTATGFLYLALLASPLYGQFPKLPTKAVHLVARRLLGLSAFYFALLHASFAFFGSFGGFSNLNLILETSYFRPVAYGFGSLVILTVMASTSFDWAVRKLGRKWKMIHRFVYLASFLIVLHALSLGSHFQDLSGTIPRIFFAALFILLVLETLRFDRYISQKFSSLPKFGPALVIGLVIISFAVVVFFRPQFLNEVNNSLGLHSAHQELARQNQQTSSNNLPPIPGLDGDRNKRYTVSIKAPEQIEPNQSVKLEFRVFDASSGSPVTFLRTPYEKAFHLIIVDSALNFYSHLHPEQFDTVFSIETSFPKADRYRLYTDFQPLGGIEQQMAFTLQVGNAPTSIRSTDPSRKKTVGNYEVELETSSNLNAKDMSLGEQKISFTVREAQTKKEVTTLKPYLNTYGHLVMINHSTYEYLHVHPANLQVPKADQTFGPKVEFLPIGIYGPFSAGTYRAFVQINPNGELITVPFDLIVK